MERLSQEKKVHAALLKNDIDLRYLNVEVVESGVARIGGIVFAKEDQLKIVEIAKGVAGISDVRAEITVTPPRIS